MHETLDALQFTVSTLKFLISQPTTTENDRVLYGAKLLYVEGLLKRLVSLVQIGPPINKYYL